MFGLGTQEMLVILVLVFLFFGAGKLPQVGSALGSGLRNFNKGLKDEVEQARNVEEEKLSKTCPLPLRSSKQKGGDRPPNNRGGRRLFNPLTRLFVYFQKMASTGHVSAQAPHPSQISSSILYLSRYSFIACTGQVSTQAAHARQSLVM